MKTDEVQGILKKHRHERGGLISILESVQAKYGYLPEAQPDRFMFKILIDYLPEDDEIAVVNNTTGVAAMSVEPLLSGRNILDFQHIVRQVPAAEAVTRYAVRLVAASRHWG